MEFTIRRDLFLESIHRTLSIVEKKTLNPIFNNVLITTNEDRIKIVATDREVTLVTEYECQVKVEGGIALMGRKLYELIRECQGEIVHVYIGENNIARISCDKAVFKMYGLPAENYPLPALEDFSQEPMRLSAEVIRDMINCTQYSVSTDEMKKNLVGVYFHSLYEDETNWVVMVATDGNRLSLVKKAVFGGDWSILNNGVIIHKRSLMEIKRQLEVSSGEVSFWVDRGAIIFKEGTNILRVSLVAEQYPNYQKVIPTEWYATIRFNKGAILHALRRMSVLAGGENNGVVMNIQGSLMTMYSVDVELGEANEELEIQYDGPDVEISFNVNYLIAAIEVIKEEDVLFRLSNQKKATIITGADSEEYMALVMQLRKK